jgi:hypothetical protein
MKAIFTYVTYYKDMWINMYDKEFQKIKAFKKNIGHKVKDY